MSFFFPVVIFTIITATTAIAAATIMAIATIIETGGMMIAVIGIGATSAVGGTAATEPLTMLF